MASAWRGITANRLPSGFQGGDQGNNRVRTEQPLASINRVSFVKGNCFGGITFVYSR